MTLPRRDALALASDHLRREGSTLDATHATREAGVWVVGVVVPHDPSTPLQGGGLVVTDGGEVHALGSAPGALDDLLRSLGLPDPGEVPSGRRG